MRSLGDNHSEGFFSSFLLQSSYDNEEGIAANWRHSIGTRKHSQSSVARSVALLSSSSLHSMMGGSTSILPGLTSIFHSGEPSRIPGGGALIRAASRNSLSTKDNDYEYRRYAASKTSKTTSTAPQTPSPRPLASRIRTVSWSDQIRSRAATSPSPSSDLDLPEAQTTHGSENAPLFEQNYSDSSPSSSTLSLNSPFSSNLYLPMRPRTYQTDIANPMPANLRDLSPFKGKPLWEPEDDEWAEMDAKHISSTFKASFKDPGQYSPRKTRTSTGTLSHLTTTLTSFLPSSPTKRTSDAVLREEEALRDNLEELQNTYYSNPAGDLCDTVMKSVFLSGSRYFHDTRDSVRVPHVIDLEAYFTTQDALIRAAYPRLSDAIATILSHTDRDCIEAFLDPRVEEFVYRREVNRSAAGSILVIRRNGNQIIVSHPFSMLSLNSCGK
jgi:hypothetical protein